ncbi:MAG TPA: outer membrane beta-barrel protein [Alphaproteobacteria bacterium]|nr:outer membrane beta-barrel protein [Alphaproteobacteria bacterium]
MRVASIAIAAAAAAAIMVGGEKAASAQQTPPATSGSAASASPAPTPTPTATPFASGSIGGALMVFGISTSNVNATGALDTATGADLASRADLSDMLITGSVTSGYYKANATVGGYNFPTIGTAINSTFNNYKSLTSNATCANTSCFGLVPIYQATYTSPDQHLTIYGGQIGTLLGAEGAFTYQNVNIQRGLGWALEPVVSRGVHVGYTNGPWTLALEDNDGFYSGSLRTIEYEVSWAPSSTTSLTFVGMNPGANVPGNATAFIANQSEYNLYYTHTAGRWQFSPYVLFVSSPASAPLGYTSAESDYAVSLLGAYSFSSAWSVGFRAEYAENEAATNATSPNAFLLYGPGSNATTFTLTPTYKFGGNGMVRVEWSNVVVRDGLGGTLFGPAGVATSQNRFGIELGVSK